MAKVGYIFIATNGEEYARTRLGCSNTAVFR